MAHKNQNRIKDQRKWCTIPLATAANMHTSTYTVFLCIRIFLFLFFFVLMADISYCFSCPVLICDADPATTISRYMCVCADVC